MNGMLRGPAAFACAFAIAVATEGSANASPVPSPPTTAPRASAVAYLVNEIALGLGPLPAGVMIVASSITSDVPAPKSDALAVRFATQLAGRLTAARAHPQPATLAVARRLSGRERGRATSLVYVQIGIEHGTLRIVTDLYPIVPNSWDRIRKPLPGPRAHAFASAPLDAEVRTFLSPILLEQASLHKAKHDEGEVLAVGCGDIDGDGGLELVLASRERVSLGRLRGGKFEVQKSAPWASLAARTPVPMREPIGTVIVSPRGHPGEIYLGMTDRGGVVTDANLVTKRVLTGLPIPGFDGDACMMQIPETAAFDRRAVVCKAQANGDPALVGVLPLPRHDAASAFALVGKNGSVSEIAATREPSGKLRVRQIMQDTSDPASANAGNAVNSSTMEDMGAQIAVADLDLDGIAEVVTTTNSMGDDAITVSSLNFDRSVLVPRLHFAAKDGVRALGVCPPEERGVPALVAVVGSEVWLVR
ncbi:MAG: hypothetical protein FWD73_15650 [Polyangiaceae bacterium]|nr:hypothetical protein [Polyangiaceae bacterium]